jgi:hypothetical protein
MRRKGMGMGGMPLSCIIVVCKEVPIHFVDDLVLRQANPIAISVEDLLWSFMGVVDKFLLAF